MLNNYSPEDEIFRKKLFDFEEEPAADAFDKILKGLEATESFPAPVPMSVTKTFTISWKMAVAASVTALVSVAVIWYSSQINTSNEQHIVSNSKMLSSKHKKNNSEIFTPHLIVKGTDESKKASIELNSNSITENYIAKSSKEEVFTISKEAISIIEEEENFNSSLVSNAVDGGYVTGNPSGTLPSVEPLKVIACVDQNMVNGNECMIQSQAEARTNYANKTTKEQHSRSGISYFAGVRSSYIYQKVTPNHEDTIRILQMNEVNHFQTGRQATELNVGTQIPITPWMGVQLSAATAYMRNEFQYERAGQAGPTVFYFVDSLNTYQGKSRYLTYSDKVIQNQWAVKTGVDVYFEKGISSASAIQVSAGVHITKALRDKTTYLSNKQDERSELKNEYSKRIRKSFQAEARYVRHLPKYNIACSAGPFIAIDDASIGGINVPFSSRFIRTGCSLRMQW